MDGTADGVAVPARALAAADGDSAADGHAGLVGLAGGSADVGGVVVRRDLWGRIPTLSEGLHLAGELTRQLNRRHEWGLIFRRVY